MLFGEEILCSVKMKKHSSGALSKEERKEQDRIYAEGHEYDYVIIGTGSVALTVGALLAHSGKKICMLEAHDCPGGYAHTFKRGDYSFCAQVHYIWGCGKGGKIYEFLKKIGLEKDITFNLYDPEGYDQMVLPDGKKVGLGYGYDRVIENIEKVYPGQAGKVRKFCGILARMRKELRKLPDKVNWWEYIYRWPMFLGLLQYKNKTLQNVFDECRLSKEAQLVLCGEIGDVGVPPKDLSFLAYVGLFCGYNLGAYYPNKHYSYYIERLAKSITDHEGCHIYYETEVSGIDVEDGRVCGVKTKDKIFHADRYICNMDPRRAGEMIGLEKFPSSFRKKLSYSYSPAGFMIYLGLKKGFDLKKYGFGKHNTWHFLQWDMNQMWKECLEGNFEKSLMFMSTPTLHSSFPGIAPKGAHILELATFTNYSLFAEAQKKGYGEYVRLKNKIAGKMLDLVEKHYIPDLRKHISVKVVGSPMTCEDFVMAPFGNAYGSLMTPKQTINRVGAQSPFKNFYWCNASSGYPGIYGTVHTGASLYMDLTKDYYYQSVSDEESLGMLRSGFQDR